MIIGNDDNDFSADDDDDDDFYVDEDDDYRHWPYGKRSRYVVKPHLVDSLQVHYVNRSEQYLECETESNKFTRVFLKCHNVIIRNQPGFEVRVLKPKEGILAHFRFGSSSSLC